ncbi:unnamed protein product [Orchesella dallaii]|uniref:Broad-complex core protein n=1 Tax=Orchesella dallaii TaxID=48710 RepID=A0ABP1Q3E9_9HEXA
MAAAQQFSLRWNNYSQHIVTALEELRVDDELTDVTLSCEGQRVKAHKLLLSACSVFFKETFKENPCKHPIIILKGVSFADLQAVIQFMYNGQVNVTQERLPSFLQTAEILQIKGLTDSANSDKEETPTATKKRPQTFPAQASSVVDSIRQDSDSRPPTPKRKRVIGSAPSAQSSELTGTASVISASGNTVGGGGSSSHSTNNQSNPPPPPLVAHNSENSRDGLPIKYEEQDLDDSHYDRSTLSEDNDNSFQDNGNDEISGDQNSLGFNIRSSNGAGERRPRYALQPSNDHTAGIVDATNVTSPRQNGIPSRDLIADGMDTKKVYVTLNGNGSKLRSRLNSRSLSSSGSGGYQQQDDRVIKYAPLQSYNQDSRSNSSQEGVDAMFVDEASESPQLTDEEDDQQSFGSHNQRRMSLNSGSGLQQKSSRGMPHLVKANSSFNSSSQQQMTHRNNNVINGNISIVKGNTHSNISRGGPARGSAEEITVSSQADMSTPSFSLTQQLLQQNVLCLISSNGTEVIKSSIGSNSNGGGNNSTTRISAIAVQPSSGNGVGEQAQVAPYVCDICGKRYVHHRSLNDHKKSHTGATRCPVCNKSFSKVANMRAHYAAQHGGNSQLNDGGESSSNDVQQTQQLNGRVVL